MKRYVDGEQKSVYYQVTPLYNGEDERPYGVIMEAVSVEGDEFYDIEKIVENPQAEAEAEAKKRENEPCTK